MPLTPRHLMYAVVGGNPLIKYSTCGELPAMMFNELTVQHAFRLVFATGPNVFARRVRPPAVNPEIFEHEAREWKKWDAEQSAAEAALEDESTWPTRQVD